MESQTIALAPVDQVLAILHATNDGDNLAPRDLWLTELAIKNNLSAAGEEAFLKLYNEVCISGTYDKRKVWFHGIEHVTRDHAGYIQWKGVTIEHFTFANGDRAREAAEELQSTCLTMERFGISVQSRAAYFDWLCVMRPAKQLPGRLLLVNGVEAFVKLVGYETSPRNEGYIADRRRNLESALQIVGSAVQVAGASRLACDIWYDRGCDAMLTLTFDRCGATGEACHDALRARVSSAGDVAAIKLLHSAVATAGENPRFGVMFPAGMVGKTVDRVEPFIRLIGMLDDVAKAT